MTASEPAGRIALGLDPSLVATGWALVTQPSPNTFALLSAGTIRPGGGPTAHRIARLFDLVRNLAMESGAGLLAVEAPQERAMAPSGFGRRSILTLPALGSAYAAVLLAARSLGTPAGGNATVVVVEPLAWTRALRAPSPRGDPRKAARVRYAAALMGVGESSFGPAARASNAADAALIAAWALLTNGKCGTLTA